jgi:hypothetical protein
MNPKRKILCKSCFGLFTLFILFILYSQSVLADNEKIIFLHHSTGEGVYWDGGVPEWISDYNSEHGTSYQIFERNYPDSPYPWENYPYDYWNLWINGACDSGNPNIECMDTLTQSYDVIIFKHCFPGAAVEPDTGNPDITSQTKSLENYKLQYQALRDMIDSYPNNVFIVWTLAPLHRLATTEDEATRAKEFVDWVKNNFLTEDGNNHPNITIFDFWGIVAEDDPNPSMGKVNCLKYEYEGSHFSSDSHPNYTANQTAGPQFAQTIVDAIENYFGTSSDVGDDNETDTEDDDNGDSDEDDDDGGDNDCVAAQLLGTVDPQLAILRTFRDEMLTNSTIGEKLIEIYYNNENIIAAIMNKSPMLKTLTKKLLESVISVIEQLYVL